MLCSFQLKRLSIGINGLKVTDYHQIQNSVKNLLSSSPFLSENGREKSRINVEGRMRGVIGGGLAKEGG